MGRIQKQSMRTRLQDQMTHLRKKYRAALNNDALQEAFDEFWGNWSSEMAAMIYAEVLSTMDLLLLTATVDNRRVLMELRSELEVLAEETIKLKG